MRDDDFQETFCMTSRGKILITGGNGFIGGHVCRDLARDHELRALVRNKEGIAPEIETVVFRDPSDPRIPPALSGIEVVVHIAAQLHGKRDELWQANVEFTSLLLDEAAKQGVQHFVYLSSENVELGQQDLYSQSKREAETLVEAFTAHTILRPTVIYGPGDSKYVTRLAGMVQRLPVVPMLGMGHNRFQFLYVGDLVALIRSAIENRIYGTYVLAGPESVKYKDLMRTLIQIMHKRRFVLPVPLLILQPLAWCLDRSLAHPPITPGQLANLRKDRNYDMRETYERFGHEPTQLADGLSRLVTEEFPP